MKICRVVELGRIGYGDALSLQQQLVDARKRGDAPDTLLLCEHPHVFTLGRNGKIENLLASHDELRQRDIEFHHTSRGGDITYHGPGQIVGYPVLNLAEIRRDVGWYVRQLEQTMIAATAAFGLKTFRIAGCTGVWTTPTGATLGAAKVHGESDSLRAVRRLPERKLGAIGVHLSRWVTSHGFAYNVAPDLRYFDLIVPCGIANRGVTSLETALGRHITPAEVMPHIVAGFAEALGLETVVSTREELAERIAAAAAEPIENVSTL
jgi:lipoyl(octanoyl) transferase